MPSKKKPAYLLHKPTGQARVRIDGKDHYLGPYGSREGRECYDDLIAEWFAKLGDVTGYKLTVDNLAILYLEHAKEHYRKDGDETSELYLIKLALRHLVGVHGTTRARDFSPRKLKEVRQSMIDAGWVRTSINSHMGRVKRLFRWAVENEHVPVAVFQALGTVRGLQKGRTKAKEAEPVEPVTEETITSTIPFLPRQVTAMIKLQLLTGGRPSEFCGMRPCDITLGTEGVWIYRPESHKTEHHGKDRRIFIGPEGQDVLRPFLDRDPEAYCFSPAEAEAEGNAKRRANRKSPLTPSQRARKPKENRKRRPKNRYTKDSYRRAIARACEQAFGMPAELRNICKALKDVPEDQGVHNRICAPAVGW